MFLHLGGDALISSCEVVAILNADSLSASRQMAEYMDFARSFGKLRDVSGGHVRSIVVTEGLVYLSSVSPATLGYRCAVWDGWRKASEA